MSRLVRFSILLFCSGLLAGCGGSGTDQYQTFQPGEDPLGAAQPTTEPQTPAVAAVAAAAQPVSEAVAGTVSQTSAAMPENPGATGESTAAVTEPAVATPEPAAVRPEAGVTLPEATADTTAAAVTQPASNGQAAGGAVAGPEVISAQSGLTGPADRPAIDNGVEGQARQIQLLIPQKRFRRERPSEAVRVSYDDIDLLKVLNMEPVPANATEHFPDWLKSLDGKLVRIRGFMYPTYVATGLTEFALARDNGICCFVRQPKIYDIMTVQLAEGETTDYIANRPFDVEGIFRIDPDADQPQLSRLYRIEQAKVLQ